MSKKQIYFTDAERMYVEEQLSLNDISSNLDINYKTLHSWKQKGNWNQKRTDFIKNKQAFHERAYNFAQKLMNSIEDDLDSGKKPEIGRLYTITKMLSMIIKVKEYQDSASKKQFAEDKTSLSPEEMREIEELLGLRRRPKGE